MRIAIDVLALLGGLLVAVGLHLEFSISWALVYAGLHLTGFSLMAAHAHKSDVTDVPDAESETE